MSETTAGYAARAARPADLTATVERQQQMLQQQQLEIEALLELLIDKHVTSLGEFKAHMAKLRHGSARSQQLHDALNIGMPAAVTAPGKPVAVAAPPAARPVPAPAPAPRPAS